MFGLGAGEILIILVFALVFIGPKKLPELARNLGRSLREFQKAKDDFLDHVNDDDDHKPNKLTGVASEAPEQIKDDDDHVQPEKAEKKESKDKRENLKKEV